MEVFTRRASETPEGLVTSLLNRLRHHVLWDLLLVYLPPLVIAIHCVTDLYRRRWLTESLFAILVLAGAALAVIIVMKRYRTALPALTAAAHLIDERTGATDRFITLSTVDRSHCAPSLLQRLRAEATEFLQSVKLRQDFPYRLKRSFYLSLLGSLIFAALFHLMIPLVKSHYDTVPMRLREIAAKIERQAQIAALGRALQKLAAQIEDPKLSSQEKQTALEQMQKQIDQERQKQQTNENRDLLDQAASTVKGTEQQSGAGQQEQKNPDKGGGGIQSNLPQEGKGNGNSSAGSGGDSKGDAAAQLSKDGQQGKPAQGEPKDQSGEKNQQKGGEGKGGDRPDLSQADRDTGRDMSGKTQDDRENQQGKNKQPESIPQGAPPAERFNRPGEQGNQGVKGARYVTVQLPEEVAGDAKGAANGTKDSRGNRIGAKLPVSNIPLPARVPDAPSEKQQVPLEYRQIIR